MNKLTFLGTASAVPDEDQQNTHFIIETKSRNILVDCVGNPVVRLKQAGVDPLSISDLVVTHFHPDHVSGVPLLLMDLWLMGRETPLYLYGLNEVLDRIEKMMSLFDWESWLDFYSVNFVRSQGKTQTNIIDTDNVKVWTAPVSHMIPAIGLRIATPKCVLCYSSDTAPCDAVIDLAQDADILIHEATGEGQGHSSPEQAGQIAQQAGVRKLYLIHYPVDAEVNDWVNRAKTCFSGGVVAARDLMTIEFS